MIQTMKLNKLRLSPINVRRLPEEKLQIPQMAAAAFARFSVSPTQARSRPTNMTFP